MMMMMTIIIIHCVQNSNRNIKTRAGQPGLHMALKLPLKCKNIKREMLGSNTKYRLYPQTKDEVGVTYTESKLKDDTFMERLHAVRNEKFTVWRPVLDIDDTMDKTLLRTLLQHQGL